MRLALIDLHILSCLARFTNSKKDQMVSDDVEVVFMVNSCKKIIHFFVAFAN